MQTQAGANTAGNTAGSKLEETQPGANTAGSKHKLERWPNG